MPQPRTKTSWPRFCCAFLGLGILYLLFGAIYLTVVSKPRIYVVFASIPSLDNHLRYTNDSSVSFVLLLSNTNKFAGVYYDNITVSLSDGQNRSFSVGNYSFGGFYQGFSKKATRGKQVDEDNIGRIKRLENGSVIVRFDVATKVRLKGIIGRTGRKGVHVWGIVTINAREREIAKQIRLKSHGKKAALSSTVLAFLAIVYSQLI